jgi:uncharacterized protein YaiI (UPF0178 family)
MNEITKHKISLKMKNKKKTATHRKHIKEALRNQQKSNEHKKAISKAMKKFWQEKKRS